MNLVITTKKSLEESNPTAVVEAAAVDVEVTVEAEEEVVLVAPASNAEKRDTSQETAPRSKEVVREVAVLSVDLDPALATSADRKVTTPVTAPPRREVTATEVVVLSVDRDPVLATSAEKRVTTPVTAPRNREVLAVLSVDPDPALATSAEKRDISSETAPRRREENASRDRSSATPATRWATCPVTAPRAVSPDREVAAVTASTATNPDISPEIAPKETLLVAPEVAVVATVDPDLPVLATDVDKRVTSLLTALSPIPEAKNKARTRTRRSDPFPHSTTH